MNPHDWDSLTSREEIKAVTHRATSIDEAHLQVMLYRRRAKQGRRLMDEYEHADDQERAEAALCELCAAPERDERPGSALSAAQSEPVR
ncbi:MAG: hypothetical protein V2A79_10265 [Planctomycetota bacterium]